MKIKKIKKFLQIYYKRVNAEVAKVVLKETKMLYRAIKTQAKNEKIEKEEKKVKAEATETKPEAEKNNYYDDEDDNDEYDTDEDDED